MVNTDLLNQLILLVISVTLVLYCWYVQYKHNQIVNNLTKKIMAKSYNEYSRAEAAFLAASEKPVKSKDSDKDNEFVKL